MTTKMEAEAHPLQPILHAINNGIAENLNIGAQVYGSIAGQPTADPGIGIR
jgi:hypothetical protein